MVFVINDFVSTFFFPPTVPEQNTTQEKLRFYYGVVFVVVTIKM